MGGADERADGEEKVFDCYRTREECEKDKCLVLSSCLVSSWNNLLESSITYYIWNIVLFGWFI